MKIVHIQYKMPPAGNAAYRLHEAMLKYGINSSILTLEQSAQKDNVYTLHKGISVVIQKSIDYLYKKYKRYGLKKDAYFYSSLPICGRDIFSHPIVRDADVIYLHWVAGASTSIRNIEALARTGKPIIFFLHDMWAVTGGCHHSFNCNQYLKDCAQCQMFSFNKHGVHSQLIQKKQLYSIYSNICFISPSKWMAKKAECSFALQGKILTTIPNVVDETVFKPLPKPIVRDILNLPQDKILITFGSVGGTTNPYKGWRYLRDAINMIDMPNVEIIIYGSGYNEKTVQEIKYPIHFLGNILDETKLALITNASDLFVFPSLCESFSLVVLEHLLCNIPVVGFDCSAIPELVKTNETGYLAKFQNAEDMATGIKELLSNSLSLKFRENYSSMEIVKQHLKFINTMLQS